MEKLGVVVVPPTQVRRAFLLALNVVCMAPKCQKGLQSEASAIVQKLLEDTKIKQEFIREVDLGPFKHKLDDGLPLRKAAYQAVVSVLKAYPEQVARPLIMEFVVQGLNDTEDVQILCCQILTELCQWSKSAVLSSLDRIVEPVDKAINKALKAFGSQRLAHGGSESDRVADTIRLFARTLQHVYASLKQESELSPGFMELLTHLMQNNTFEHYWEQYTARG